MPYGAIPSIGSLRWLCTLCSRVQTPAGTGISESFTNQQQVWAEITPVGTQTWIGGEQIGTPVTHRVTIRWQDGVDMFDCITRDTTRPDSTQKQDIFRIRRVADWQGRQRFLILDVELEQRVG